MGQQIHLIQDMAQPAHVRNDAHPADDSGWIPGLEYWGKTHPDEVRSIASSPMFPAVNLSISNGGYPPITQFFDTDQYNGTNPSASLSQGLSEYTNANFFSEDTINTAIFPYPRITSETPIVAASYTSKYWGATYIRQYYLKNSLGETNGSVGYLLSAVDYLDYYRQKYPLLGGLLAKNPVLDDNVYDNYASLLIPRAVGYSAGLLNYFFRGTLEITAPDSTVYSITDGSIIPQQFTKIRAKVQNTTPGESIGNGTIQAVARYKKRTDYQADLSTDPPLATSRDTDFSYSVSAPVSITSLASDTPTEYTFDFSGSLIPAGITDLYLHVIFKGTLGNETDNAIAVGMKDLMEPTHLVFWNLTDRFSLGIYNDTTSTWNYHLYTAAQIKADPILLAEAGSAHIDPYPVSFEISFPKDLLSATPQIAMAQDLQAGRHIRLITLTEQISNYVRVKVTDSIDGSVKDYNLTFQSAMNQEYGGVFEPLTPVETFRTIKQHYHQGVLRCQPKMTDTSGDTYCPYPDEDAVKPADITPNQAVMSFP